MLFFKEALIVFFFMHPNGIVKKIWVYSFLLTKMLNVTVMGPLPHPSMDSNNSPVIVEIVYL